MPSKNPSEKHFLKKPSKNPSKKRVVAWPLGVRPNRRRKNYGHEAFSKNGKIKVVSLFLCLYICLVCGGWAKRFPISRQLHSNLVLWPIARDSPPLKSSFQGGKVWPGPVHKGFYNRHPSALQQNQKTFLGRVRETCAQNDYGTVKRGPQTVVGDEGEESRGHKEVKSDREIHAPPPQNRRSTSQVQNCGWCVFCLALMFRSFAHPPPPDEEDLLLGWCVVGGPQLQRALKTITSSN